MPSQKAVVSPPSSDARGKNTIVFVHIPKTAGTAFSHYLTTNCSDPSKAMWTFYGDYSIYDDVRDVPVILGHTFYLEMAQKLPHASFVTWLRHPLDRIVSQYKSWRTKQLEPHWTENADGSRVKHQFEHIRFAQKATFEEFALSDSRLVLNACHFNVQTITLSSYRPTYSRPEECLRWIRQRLTGRQLLPPSRRAAARILASAKENLEHAFAFFGIVERFDESIQLFRHSVGWTAEFDSNEEAANRSPQIDLQITDRARRRIMELNELDMELYEFGCRLLDERLRALSDQRAAAA